jgi:hypothetical protein
MLNIDTIEVNLMRGMNSHWKTNSFEQLFIEGQERVTNVAQRYIEVKYFGPFYDRDVDGIFTVSIQVHLDCAVIGTVDNRQDVYELNRLTGKMSAIAWLPIFIPEFGHCLICDGVRTLPKGQIAIKTKEKISVVEADYHITLDPQEYEEEGD